MFFQHKKILTVLDAKMAAQKIENLTVDLKNSIFPLVPKYAVMGMFFFKDFPDVSYELIEKWFNGRVPVEIFSSKNTQAIQSMKDLQKRLEYINHIKKSVENLNENTTSLHERIQIRYLHFLYVAKFLEQALTFYRSQKDFQIFTKKEISTNIQSQLNALDNMKQSCLDLVNAVEPEFDDALAEIINDGFIFFKITKNNGILSFNIEKEIHQSAQISPKTGRVRAPSISNEDKVRPVLLNKFTHDSVETSYAKPLYRAAQPNRGNPLNLVRNGFLHGSTEPIDVHELSHEKLREHHSNSKYGFISTSTRLNVASNFRRGLLFILDLRKQTVIDTGKELDLDSSDPDYEYEMVAFPEIRRSFVGGFMTLDTETYNKGESFFVNPGNLFALRSRLFKNLRDAPDSNEANSDKVYLENLLNDISAYFNGSFEHSIEQTLNELVSLSSDSKLARYENSNKHSISP